MTSLYLNQSKASPESKSTCQSVKGLENFKTESRSSRQGEVFIINSIKANFWQIQNSFDIADYSKESTKFEIDKYNKWKNAQDAKRKTILSRKAALVATAQSSEIQQTNPNAQTTVSPTIIIHDDYLTNAFLQMARSRLNTDISS